MASVKEIMIRRKSNDIVRNGLREVWKCGKMLTQKGIVPTSDSMCAEAHDNMA